MANILIVANYHQKGISTFTQGIKLFINKNKKAKLTIIGNTDEMLVLTGKENITLINSNKSYSQPSDLEDETVDLTIAFKMLTTNEEAFDSFICAADISIVKMYAEKYLKSTSHHSLITTYPNAYTGKKTALGDVGYKEMNTLEDFKNLYNEVFTYETKVNAIEKPNFKFLVNDINNLTAFEKEIDENFKAQENYQGLLVKDEFLTPEADFVIGNPNLIVPLISGINQGIEVYDNYIENGTKGVFTYKIGNKILEKLFMRFHSSIDQRTTSNGTYLSGYAPHIVLVNPHSSSIGVQVSIELGVRIHAVYKSE